MEYDIYTWASETRSFELRDKIAAELSKKLNHGTENFLWNVFTSSTPMKVEADKSYVEVCFDRAIPISEHKTKMYFHLSFKSAAISVKDAEQDLMEVVKSIEALSPPSQYKIGIPELEQMWFNERSGETRDTSYQHYSTYINFFVIADFSAMIEADENRRVEMMLKYSAILKKPCQREDWQRGIHLGLDYKSYKEGVRKSVFWEMDRSAPHLSIDGGSEFARTDLIEQIVYGADRGGFDVVVPDVWRKNEMLEVLETLEAEMNNRNDLLNHIDAGAWYNMPSGTSFAPVLIVIRHFDKLAQLVEEGRRDRKIYKLLNTFVRGGRSTGFHVVIENLETANKTLYGSELLNNVTVRIKMYPSPPLYTVSYHIGNYFCTLINGSPTAELQIPVSSQIWR